MIKEIDFLANTHLSVKKFNSELYKAIDSNNKESLWQLSKLITKYQIQYQARQLFKDS